MGLTGATAYTHLSATTGVENANPHRLIEMLIDGAIEKINRAKFFMKKENIEQKGKHISWAISIISGLRSSLNIEQGGEVAKNLDALYDYCCFTLIAANHENDEDKLNSVLSVMQQVQEGWSGIREQAKQLEE